ncbi:MAG: DsbA family protein [Halobacteriota archaeon]
MHSTRRAILAAAGSAATIGSAGCLGDDGDGGALADTSYDCEVSDPDPVSELPSPVLGDPEAPVRMLLFEDYACGGCAAFSTGPFGDLQADYVDAGQVRVEFYDLPIPVSEAWSYPIASAARSVQDTVGDDAFFEFSKSVFEHIDEYSWQTIGDVAADVGADPCTVLAAGTTESYRAVSESDREYGISIGIEGTPGIVVEDVLVRYDSPAEAYDPVAAAIEDALA